MPEKQKEPFTRFFNLSLLLIVGEMIFADYWAYSRSYYKDPGIWSTPLQGRASAPEQYRVAVLKFADFLSRHSHIGMRHALTVIDFTATLIAVFVLSSLGKIYFRQNGFTREQQMLGSIIFLGLVQYYFLWVTDYQRPETLTSAMLVSLSFLLLKWKLPLQEKISSLCSAFLLIALAVMQGFVRADVAFALHAGVFLTCVFSNGKEFVLTRKVQLATSAVAALCAGGIQYYLMHDVYPYATYGTTPVVEFWLNWGPRRLLPFGLFVFPFIATAFFAIRRRYRLDGAAVALVISSVIYLGMWFAVGKIDEERIFLPFALAIAPVTAFLFTARLFPEKFQRNNLA